MFAVDGGVSFCRRRYTRHRAVAFVGVNDHPVKGNRARLHGPAPARRYAFQRVCVGDGLEDRIARVEGLLHAATRSALVVIAHAPSCSGAPAIVPQVLAWASATWPTHPAKLRGSPSGMKP